MLKYLKNVFFKKSIRKLYNTNQAVVGIVVAVLLIGLLVSVISIIQLVYVPNWMEEIESEHIDNVFDQFCQLKLVIDTQSANKKLFTPIVTSINLGTNKIPFFMSTRAAGGLNIIRNNILDDGCIVEIVDDTDTYTYPLGAIRFTSANAYYIPDERISFIYENGALITNQTAGNALNIKPSLGISNGVIYFDLINISGVGGKISKFGYDIEHIRTEFNNTTIITFHNVSHLWIKTPHWDIWGPFIVDTLENIAYPHTGSSSSAGVDIHFSDLDNRPDIKIIITTIKAQIGPGWIETD